MPNHVARTILITAVGGRSVGYQLVRALQSVGTYRIVVVDCDPFAAGLHDPSVAAAHVVPSVAEPNYLQEIADIAKREDATVILPGSDFELEILARNHLSLPCRVIINPISVVIRCRNKWRLHQWLVGQGIATPKTVRVVDRKCDWSTFVDCVGWPLVGKPTEQSGASRGVELLTDESEVKGYLSRYASREILLQEYVGSPEEEYTIGVTVGRDGHVIDSIAIRRELTGLGLHAEENVSSVRYAISSGYSQGTVIDAPALRESCERLALALGVRGPCNVQCRLLVDGNPVVFEVHARFSGSVAIRASAGVNEPDLLIRDAFGEDVGRQRQDVGLVGSRYLGHFVTHAPA